MATSLLLSPAVSCSVHNLVCCPKEPVICPGLRAGVVRPKLGLLESRKGGFWENLQKMLPEGRGWGPVGPGGPGEAPLASTLGALGDP